MIKFKKVKGNNLNDHYKIKQINFSKELFKDEIQK